MSAAGPLAATAPRLVETGRALLVRFGLDIVLILAWQWAASRAGSIFFPPPLEILEHAAALWLSGPPSRLFLADGVFHDVLPSLARLLSGWALARWAQLHAARAQLGLTRAQLRRVRRLIREHG